MNRIGTMTRRQIGIQTVLLAGAQALTYATSTLMLYYNAHTRAEDLTILFWSIVLTVIFSTCFAISFEQYRNYYNIRNAEQVTNELPIVTE
jgi:hypothetical protein